MMKRLNGFVALGVAALIGWLVILDYAFGGFEVFQPPFEIVVPETVKGVICATAKPGTKEDTTHVVHAEVDLNGQLLVDGDILRSHRPVIVAIRKSDGRLVELPKDVLTQQNLHRSGR